MGSLTMAVKLLLLLVLVSVLCQAQEAQETSPRQNSRQRLRALFTRRREEQRAAAAKKVVVREEEAGSGEEEGQVVSVSTSVSTSSSSEVRKVPRFQVPRKVIIESEADNEVTEAEEAAKVLSPREKARERFKLLRKGNKDSKDRLLDKLLNNLDISNSVSGGVGRRRFRPSINRDQIRQKAESGFSPAATSKPATSKFRLRLRRPHSRVSTETPVETVATTGRPEARETTVLEPVTETVEEKLTTFEQRLNTLKQTTVAETTVTTERSSLPPVRTTQERRKTTLPEVVTESEPEVRRTTEASRPRKFDFSRSRLRPRLRTTTTTTQALPQETTTIPRTTVQERRTTVQEVEVTTNIPTLRPFEIRVEESLFDSFPRIEPVFNQQQAAFSKPTASNIDALKRLQLLTQKAIRKQQSLPGAQGITPAFSSFQEPTTPFPIILEEEEEEVEDNEILVSDPFRLLPKNNVRPAFVGVTTSLVPQRKEVVEEPREIVFNVEETVRSVQQPRRLQLPARRQEEEEERTKAVQIPRQQSFNQVLPLPSKPIVFTPAKFDLPAFFTEPFTFQAFQGDHQQQQPGPGSYSYSVGIQG